MFNSIPPLLAGFYKRVSLLLLLIFTLPLAAQVQSQGDDFWLAFPRNHTGATALTFFVTGDTATSGMWEIPGLGLSDTFTVSPGHVRSISIPTTAEVFTADGIEMKGIHLSAPNNFTVYGLNQRSATTDAYLGLPTAILGTSYIIASYQGRFGGTELAVVGTDTLTSVTITPTITANGKTAGVPYVVMLNRGDVYQFRGLANSVHDLTGTMVMSNKPVAVFGATQCTNIPTTSIACDHIVEMLPPTTTWGKSFVALPLATRTGSTFRVLASEDGTIVSKDGSVVDTLDKGEFYEVIDSTSVSFEATKAVLVMQYSHSSSYDGAVADPFMMIIPPFEQFLGKYTVSTPAFGFTGHHLNIIVPNAGTASVVLDGVPIPAGNFSPIGTSGFSGSGETVGVGTHNISSTFPIGVHSYGFGSFDSYGYPGGQGLSQVATVDSLALSTTNAKPTAGTSACVSAKVEDSNGSPVPGIRVDFLVKGANSASGFSNTNGAGMASFCYTPVSPGTDTVEATSGALYDSLLLQIQPGQPGCALSLSETHTDANDSVGGSIDVTASGAVGPVSYSWTGPGGYVSAMEDISGLASGTYKVVAMDSLGCKDSLSVMIDSITAPDSACVPVDVVCRSDSSWMKSTYTEVAPWGGSWSGAMSLPAAGTYTMPVSMGQPYPWGDIDSVEGSGIIKTENNITFFRKEMTIANPSDVEMRLRMNMDDGAEVYINGVLLVREKDSKKVNWKNPYHDIHYADDGTITNGFMGNQMWDFVNTVDLDTVLVTGTNELVVVMRNLRESPDRGGFSLLLEAEVQCPAQDSCVSDSTWEESTVITTAPWGGDWFGVGGVLPDDSTYTLMAMTGQPYPWGGMPAVVGSTPIKADNDIHYFRKCFDVTDNIDVDARIRMFMDDGCEVYLNGDLLVREENVDKANWSKEPHDILYKSDGTIVNGNAGNQSYDHVETLDLDTVLVKGKNTLVIALYNLHGMKNKGGFSFRLDMTKGGAPVIVPSKDLLRGLADQALRIYPNPATGTLHLDIEAPAEGARHLSLTDLSGRLLHSVSLPATRNYHQFDVSELPAGLYLVHLRVGETIVSQKLMKF